jgi:hypothetical protein
MVALKGMVAVKGAKTSARKHSQRITRIVRKFLVLAGIRPKQKGIDGRDERSTSLQSWPCAG